jgi:hypothetical protein
VIRDKHRERNVGQGMEEMKVRTGYSLLLSRIYHCLDQNLTI